MRQKSPSAQRCDAFREGGALRITGIDRTIRTPPTGASRGAARPRSWSPHGADRAALFIGQRQSDLKMPARTRPSTFWTGQMPRMGRMPFTRSRRIALIRVGHRLARGGAPFRLSL
jgi:hypothetical protein